MNAAPTPLAQAYVREPCIGNDPRCPCQDGDPCHYRDHGDTKAMPTPRLAPTEAARCMAGIRADLGQLSQELDKVLVERNTALFALQECVLVIEGLPTLNVLYGRAVIANARKVLAELADDR